MCENTNDFSGVNVGDKLWSMQLGECEVVRVDNDTWPYVCQGVGGMECYTSDGKVMATDAFPSLFWSRPEIIAPPKPKRKVVKTVDAWANVYHGPFGCVIYGGITDARESASHDCIAACVHLTGTYEVEE